MIITEYLKAISHKVFERFITLEKNIRAGSNSFYDSYLDLTEELLRCAVSEYSVNVGSRKSCGELLRLDSVKELFTIRFGLEEYVYEKLGDYSQKINSHKHKNEKKIDPELVVSYLRVFYKASAAYARYKGAFVPELDEEYYFGLVNSLEKENEELKRRLKNFESTVKESELTAEEKDKYMLLFSFAEMENRTLEEQNEELLRRLDEADKIKLRIEKRIDGIEQRLSDVERTQSNKQKAQANDAFVYFLKNSEKLYRWLGTNEEFYRKKLISVLLTVGVILAICCETVVATMGFGFLTTYSFIMDLWGLLAISTLRCLISAKPVYNVKKYSKRGMEKFRYGKRFAYEKTGGIKTKYIVLLVLTFLSAVCHGVVCAGDKTVQYTAAIIFMDILVCLISLAFIIYVKMFLSDYEFLYFVGKNHMGKKIGIVYDILDEKYISVEEFERKYLISEKDLS